MSRRPSRSGPLGRSSSRRRSRRSPEFLDLAKGKFQWDCALAVAAPRLRQMALLLRLSDPMGPRGRRAVRRPKTKSRLVNIMDLETGRVFRGMTQAAAGMGLPVEEIRRLLDVGWLVRLFAPT